MYKLEKGLHHASRNEKLLITFYLKVLSGTESMTIIINFAFKRLFLSELCHFSFKKRARNYMRLATQSTHFQSAVFRGRTLLQRTLLQTHDLPDEYFQLLKEM